MGMFRRFVSRSSSPHRHDAEGHGATKSPSKEEPTVTRRKVVLRDLDNVKADISILISPSATLEKVAASLRRLIEQSSGRSSDKLRLTFYDDRKPRKLHHVPKRASIIYYRLTKGSGDSIIRVSATSRLTLSDSDLEDIGGDIEAGTVIGDLRRKISDRCDIKDSNRIVLIACGGFRAGRLQGNAWETRAVKKWLCRSLMIDIVGAREYLVFKGINQEYLYHPVDQVGPRGLEACALKYWLKESVLRGVDEGCSGRLRMDLDDIRLFRRGRMLGDRSRVSLNHNNNVVEFELSRDVEEKFTAAEAWLIPFTRVCGICCDEKRATDMPCRITADCGHTPTTCKECLSLWIESSMDTLSWDRLNCPDCSSRLRFEDVRRHATPETFNRYDTLATQAMLGSIPHFKWCLARGCQSGQIHRASCPKVKCHSCKAVSCAKHDVPWHSGVTCDDYDRMTRKQRKINKASERTVKEIAKPCPQCNKNVHKYDGCDHITCVCGHEWCYLCLSPYTRDEQNMLHCQHSRDCIYFAFPPPYEAGFDPFDPRQRPWMPRPPPPRPPRRPRRAGRPPPNDGDPFNFLADFGLPRDPFAPGARPPPADHMADAIAAMNMHIAAAQGRRAGRGPGQPIDNILLNIFDGENPRHRD